MCSLSSSTAQDRCRTVRCGSLYQPLQPVLRIASQMVTSGREYANFIFNFGVTNMEFFTEKMHI
jgi:hypothetical protein